MAKKGNLIGAWAFLIGVILAIVVGLLNLGATEGAWAIILVVLGIIIGLLNIGGAELKEFLLAGTALVIVSAFGWPVLLGEGYVRIVGDILQALVVLFVPATIVVALKVVFAIARK